MSKASIVGLIVIILLALIIGVLIVLYFVLPEKDDADDDADGDDGIFSDLFDQEGDDDEYQVLYGKTKNHISTSPSMGQTEECKQFTMSDFAGGGTVERNGESFDDFDYEDYLASYLHTRTNDDYYYISADESPQTEIMGYIAYNWDYPEKTIFEAPFSSMHSKELVKSADDAFPGNLDVSPGNKYLVYVMTSKDQPEFSGEIMNPFTNDSSLIIRDLASNKETEVLSGKYNRFLFDSMRDFGADGKTLFTISRDGDNFNFVKIMLDSGKVETFDEVFPGFDWTKTKWGELFEQNEMGVGYHAYFTLSPDEERLIAYKNYSASDQGSQCRPKANHKIWSFNIDEDTIETYDDGTGLMDSLEWDSNGKEFAWAQISCGGCYPDYLDAYIYKMDADGNNKEELVEELKSKILQLAWSPDDTEIAYGVYSTDFVGWIKSVDPRNKQLENVLSTRDTEGSINEGNPITLTVLNWIEIK